MRDLLNMLPRLFEKKSIKKKEPLYAEMLSLIIVEEHPGGSDGDPL